MKNLFPQFFVRAGQWAIEQRSDVQPRVLRVGWEKITKAETLLLPLKVVCDGEGHGYWDRFMVNPLPRSSDLGPVPREGVAVAPTPPPSPCRTGGCLLCTGLGPNGQRGCPTPGPARGLARPNR